MSSSSDSSGLPPQIARLFRKTAEKARERGIEDSRLSFEQLEFRMLEGMTPFDRERLEITNRTLERLFDGKTPRWVAYLDGVDEEIALFRALTDPTPDQTVQLSKLIERRQSFIDQIGCDPRAKQ